MSFYIIRTQFKDLETLEITETGIVYENDLLRSEEEAKKIMLRLPLEYPIDFIQGMIFEESISSMEENEIQFEVTSPDFPVMYQGTLRGVDLSYYQKELFLMKGTAYYKRKED